MDNNSMHRTNGARNSGPDIAAAIDQIGAGLRALAAALSIGATPSDAQMLTLAAAAKIAATSVRVIRDAIRAGELPAFGRQRDRAVRRADLDAWIASRRVIHEPIDDDDLDRRVRRLAREGASR